MIKINIVLNKVYYIMNPCYPVLKISNSHPRDNNIQFFEEGHIYKILSDDSKYTSVTTWNHTHFEQFNADEVIDTMMKGNGWKKGHKYWGLTKEQIKSQWNNNRDSAAEAGTNLHYEIECFMNMNMNKLDYTHKELYENYMLKSEVKPIEWQYFINFIKDFPDLKPYRTEWFIYNEDIKIAGSIDMVYENPDGTLSIYDWKRTKIITRINSYNKFALTPSICHLPDSNFWHYALQLNTYKTILEQKYGKIVKDLFIVRLNPDAKEKNYELIKLPNMSREIIELFEEIK